MTYGVVSSESEDHPQHRLEHAPVQYQHFDLMSAASKGGHVVGATSVNNQYKSKSDYKLYSRSPDYGSTDHLTRK